MSRVKRSLACLALALVGWSAYGQSSRWFDPNDLDTTIVLNDKFELQFTPTDSIFIEEYILENRIIDSLTKSFNNRHREALAIENRMIDQFEGKAKRIDGTLNLLLKDGRWKKLVANPSTDEADHTFEYFFKEFGYYSVRVQWGEGNGYKLINHSTDEITNLFGRPYFSENGQYVISVNVDLAARYSNNGFQLLENKNNALVLLGSYEPDAWGPISAKWIEKNKLVLKSETIESAKGGFSYLHFYTLVELKGIQ